MKLSILRANLAIVVLVFLVPLFAMAANESGTAIAKQFVGKINDAILFPLIALLIGVAMLVFLYGAFEYVAGADNETAREKGKQHLFWGVIGFLVMVSAMAILEIAATTFGLESELQNARPL